MIRRNFMLTEKQVDALEKEAKNSQVSMSEVLRKAIDLFFSKRKDTK